MADSSAELSSGFDSGSSESVFSRCLTKYQHYLDQLTPHTLLRWVLWICVAVLYVIRALLLQGWYVVSYALAIYLLNLFIAFLSPKIDPATEEYLEDGLSLPTKANEEFKPFMRRLPEFKFWYNSIRAILIAFICTCFDAFNVPVFWPILVCYFMTLFVAMMRKQIMHMIQYRYLSFSYGKIRYAGKPDADNKPEHL